MTDEQIKQNALAYRNHTKEYGETIVEASRRQLAFEEGAHSRDEEVASLLSQLEDKDGYIAHLREELYKLRNPWISVEDRLPDKWKRLKVYQGTGEECYSWITKDVFVIKDGWETPEIAFYDYDAKIWWSEFGDNIENLFGEPTHWMYIPQIEKEEVR